MGLNIIPTQLCGIFILKRGGTAMETVLIVEDEARIRNIVRDYFSAHGVECDLALSLIHI